MNFFFLRSGCGGVLGSPEDPAACDSAGGMLGSWLGKSERCALRMIWVFSCFVVSLTSSSAFSWSGVESLSQSLRVAFGFSSGRGP